MAQDDPFTLDLFGNTALSSRLGFGVTAFAGGINAEQDDDDNPDPSSPSPASSVAAEARSGSTARRERGTNFHLIGNRALAKSWKERARDNIAAIRLAATIQAEERPATVEEQERLIRFLGFGASELANFVFRRPGESEFRKGWEAIGEDLQDAVYDLDYASLVGCTQYAHFTPEFSASALRLARWPRSRAWYRHRAVFGADAGGVLRGLERHRRRARSGDGAHRTPLAAACKDHHRGFCARGVAEELRSRDRQPPFSDRTVRSDRAYRSMGLRLHDYFIARAIDLLKPGAFAVFVTSSGTMDKADTSAREHIAKTADLIAAIRLPEGSLRASAGIDVVVDLLFFRKRKIGDPEDDLSWLDLDEVRPATADESAIRVNRWFVRHPDFVLGTHTLASGPFGETYTCTPREGEELETTLADRIGLLPEAIYDGEPEVIDINPDDDGDVADLDLPQDGHVREGSYFFDKAHGLMQVLDGEPVPVTARKGRSADGIPEKHVRIIRKLIPIRDAVREVLKCQELDRQWKDAQVRLRIAWSNFVRESRALRPSLPPRSWRRS